jgi:tRNA(Ile)-lysidine synthase
MSLDAPERPIVDDELSRLFAPLASIPYVVLAVSGGGDSMALMWLYARWRALSDLPSQPVVVVTVDHGLRPESAQEATFVAGVARSLGLPHETVTWSGPKPATGLQAAAREARYALLAARATAGSDGSGAVVTAHTQDDQAETFLMRLARGSGLDGLAAMPPARPFAQQPNVMLLRPLLAIPGARLRATLRAAGQTWVDDPSNADPSNERVRWRQTAADRVVVGLSNARLGLAATRIARAREALDAAALALETSAVSIDPGMMSTIARNRFFAAPEEIQLRVLTRALSRHGGCHPPARLSEIERLADVVRTTETVPGQTLGGCFVSSGSGTLSICRESGRGLPTLELRPGDTAVWDRRFQVSLDDGAPGPCIVRAASVAEWSVLRAVIDDPHLPPSRLATTAPCFWRGSHVVALAEALIPPATDRHGLCNALNQASLGAAMAYFGCCRAEPIQGPGGFNDI